MPNPSWKPGDIIESPLGEQLTLDPAAMQVAEIYKLMIGSIVPRPIALVSTLSLSGVVNLAPFSSFNLVSSNPPCIVFSIVRKPDGSKKDTLRNIEQHSEFVVNSANEWLAEPLVHCGAEYPYEVSELEKTGLSTIPSLKVKAPRIQQAAIHFECVLQQCVEVGDGSAGSSTLVIGRVLLFHVARQLYENGRINLEKYKPIARLGGSNYTNLHDIFTLEIPRLIRR